MANGDYKRKDTDSPCIGTCSTVRGDLVCIGCYRSIDEIILWQKMSDDEKRTINKRVMEQNQNSMNELE